MTKILSLRRALTLLVLAAGSLPLVGTILLLVFWLTPHLEREAADHNRAFAVALSAQTERYLTSPQFALRSLARRTGEYQDKMQLQAALDSLLSSTDLFEAIYIVDDRLRVISLSTPPNAHIQHTDFLGLDLSGSSILQQARRKNDGVWSDAYLSPISSRSVAATAVPAGNLLLVGEISLARLSDFVRRMADDDTTITILDRRGLVVAHPNPRLTTEQVNYSDLAILQRTEITATEKFRMDGVEVIGTLADVKDLNWHVLVTQPLATVQRPILLTGILLVVISVVGVVVSWGVGLVLARRVAQRFEDLANLSEQLTTGHYPEQWPEQTLQEAERLNSSLRRMSDAVRARERELRELNQTLEEKVVERTASLKQAQQDLLRSEKLAALGSLVAGVAHELNTPIGNGLMAASSLEDMNREFSENIRTGVRRSVLDKFLGASLEASQLISRNLNRAADLVVSFKQVAIDQTTSQRRRFDLGELIHEITTTLTPTLRKAHCAVDIAVADGLQLDGYPGPLGQVLVNLLTNAMRHGYADQGGRIHIQARQLDTKHIELKVKDGGKGIATAHLERVFDPFFTTRFGEGGSGLGLHICHNIVTNLLGGHIAVESQPGEGCCFILKLPCTAPEGQNPL